METSSSALEFRAHGRGRALGLTAGPILVVIGLALTVVGVLNAGASGLLSLVIALIGAAAMTTLRQRATLTERDLTVQGRFTSRHVDLRRITAVHEDRTHTAWLASDDQRPFRVYYARPGPSESDPENSFVMAVRRRAASCGAPVGVHDELIATPPKGTSPVFSL